MRIIVLSALLATAAGVGALRAAPAQPLSPRVPALLPDLLQPAAPGEARLRGWLGARVEANETNRLARVDLEPLLAGFRKKPGTHPWIGEHLGKWMHAATLAWAASSDPGLRAKLDYAASELIKTQEPDGYLGTYVKEKRFGLLPGADWDVWSHKYNLLGLLAYHEYTGNEPALEACRKMGDLLIATFGPGRKSILSAGTHMGMASTSVLEPVVLLYRRTGEARYLDFARYIVASWNEPGGPRIIETLLRDKQVNKTANGKAYEMLSNLAGLCELARATGDRAFLAPVLIAWEDIVARRLYLTGSASQSEHFHDDFDLPNAASAHVAEGCVTTTWTQLTWQLLRLTGEARFGDELEKTLYNHLAAAQRPDGAQWCYFTPLEGVKPYGPGINCCVSSGPRAMALAPQCALLSSPARDGFPDTFTLNLPESLEGVVRIGGREAKLVWDSAFPAAGQATLRLAGQGPIKAAVRLRVPQWAQPLSAEIAGGTGAVVSAPDKGWITLAADDWSGALATIRFSLGARWVAGDHGNSNRVALLWGPWVLACDQSRNKTLPPPSFLGLAEPVKPPFTLASAPGEPLAFSAKLRSPRSDEPVAATLVPFADAGRDGGRYVVWMRAPGAPLPANPSLTAYATENRSRTGNQNGSITDGDPASHVVTFDGKPADEDWFGVAFGSPVVFNRVVFTHGRAYHNGGWFDAAHGKPVVQIRRDLNSPWTTLATLVAYPDTTARDSKGLADGQAFSLTLKSSETAVALRVLGKPAGGDDPRQAFASCAELQAFEDKEK